MNSLRKRLSMDGWLIIEYVGVNEDQSRPAMKLQMQKDAFCDQR